MLTPWGTAEPELSLEAEPVFPDQPFSTRLDDGTYLDVLAAAVSVSDGPGVTTFVRRSAIQAWNTPVEVLARWGASGSAPQCNADHASGARGCEARPGDAGH
ncbi:hypothetical protein [Nocardia cyriacigeorgica]|uniref:hypothetical protein n=1 Tax=Nocardia cyriacigeorgica TaxID=135487 RepID=UPI002455F80E|nr:hypothetical protein [Nocardia cyriacigeorgica]